MRFENIVSIKFVTHVFMFFWQKLVHVSNSDDCFNPGFSQAFKSERSLHRSPLTLEEEANVKVASLTLLLIRSFMIVAIFRFIRFRFLRFYDQLCRTLVDRNPESL